VLNLLFFPLSSFQAHWGNYQSCTAPDVIANSGVWNKARWNNITSNPGFVGTGKHLQSRRLRPLPRFKTIHQLNPKFKSCPRYDAGPRAIAPGAILPIYVQYF